MVEVLKIYDWPLSLTFFQVVNFDMPPDPAGYVHRIGRTGRANKTGASISLVSSILHGSIIYVIIRNK